MNMIIGMLSSHADITARRGRYNSLLHAGGDRRSKLALARYPWIFLFPRFTLGRHHDAVKLIRRFRRIAALTLATPASFVDLGDRWNPRRAHYRIVKALLVATSFMHRATPGLTLRLPETECSGWHYNDFCFADYFTRGWWV